ncbi:MAG: HIT domain-containing protein, partial [Acidobacteriota bacterium]|nr:HIT domain-containing protein [Acidobacteriota bacterium]
MSPNQLWAPWRTRYVTAPKSGECVFCAALAASEASERAGGDLLLERAESCFSLLNAFPYAAGHLMIAPYRHTGDMLELTLEEEADVMLLARRAVRALEQLMAPAGFNLGLNLGEPAGAGFAGHLHLHVVPRWNGDTNFMPVLADTNVISASLDATAEAIREKLGEIAGRPGR